MAINVDGRNLYTVRGGNINTSISLTPGTHQMYVKAWDTQGHYFDQVLKINAAGAAQAQGVSGYSSQHVFVLMLENRSDAVAMQWMPYLNGLVKQYSRGTQMYSASHGSWLAYGEISGGIAPKLGQALNKLCNGYGCTSPANVPNLVRQLVKDGKSWKGYFESLPSQGWMGDISGNYARKHNPFPFFTDVAYNKAQQMKMYGIQQLTSDLNTHSVGNYNLIVPDLAHDGHNPSNDQTALSNADNYLAGLIPQILASSYFQPGGDGVLIVTFDEGELVGDNHCGTNPDPNNCGGHIFLGLIGPKVKRGFQSASYHNQADILRASCDLLGLSACPGDAANAHGLPEFFTGSASGAQSVACAAPSAPGVNFCSPRQGQSFGASVQFAAAGRGASGSVQRMELWVDGRKINNYFGSQMNATVPLALGTHTATAVEVDSRGAYIKSAPVTFTSH
jgi:hypothetical protein